MRLALTLSGGGFRATLFHLGVLRYLGATGLLKDVTHICSVSGGSILAAHVGVNWHLYSSRDRANGEKHFESVATEMTTFVQSGIRNRILRRWPRNRSALLREEYSSLLSSRSDSGNEASIPATLGSLGNGDKVPEIHLAVTNLTRPQSPTSFSRYGMHIHGTGGSHIYYPPFDLATAVCASSAFPIMFPAVRVTHSQFGPHGVDKLAPPHQYLTDGGVFDNLGLRTLRSIIGDAKDVELIIVSDAGAYARTDPDSAFRGIYLFARAFAISGQRVCDLETEASESGLWAAKIVPVSIHRIVTPATISEVEQLQLGHVRTDLDAFSDSLADRLSLHGYAVAQQTIEVACRDRGLAVPESMWAQWHSLARARVKQRASMADLEALCRESRRRVQLVSRNDLWPLLAHFLVICLASILIYKCVAWWNVPHAIEKGLARLETDQLDAAVLPKVDLNRHSVLVEGLASLNTIPNVSKWTMTVMAWENGALQPISESAEWNKKDSQKFKIVPDKLQEAKFNTAALDVRLRWETPSGRTGDHLIRVVWLEVIPEDNE